jgi:hypothetical protein
MVRAQCNFHELILLKAEQNLSVTKIADPDGPAAEHQNLFPMLVLRQLPFLIYVVDGRINGFNRGHTMTTFIHAWLLPNGA